LSPKIARERYRRDESYRAKIRERRDAWRLKYPERTRAQVAAANSRRRARQSGTFASRDHAVIDFYQFAAMAAFAPCAYCGQDPGTGRREVDHKTPFARGGAHSIDNLAIACRRCNNSKGEMTASEFLALPAYERTPEAAR
jgi:5-methylcytosine-specific restriction endonuclease McrA